MQAVSTGMGVELTEDELLFSLQILVDPASDSPSHSLDGSGHGGGVVVCFSASVICC